MGKRKTGWRGEAVGKELLLIWNKNLLGVSIQNAKEKREQLRERISALGGMDYFVFKNYNKVCTDYISLYNALSLYKTEFQKHYYHILLIASKFYLDAYELLPQHWKIEDYEATRSIISAEANILNINECYTDAKKALVQALSFYRLSKIYSLAFIGDETSLAFKRETRDALYSVYVDMGKVLNASAKNFRVEVKDFSAFTIPEANEKKLLEKLFSLDFRKDLFISCVQNSNLLLEGMKI